MVPEDWQLTTFEDHIDLLSGFAFKSNGYTDNGADIGGLQEQIAPATRAIHSYWLARRNPVAVRSATYIRREQRMGRNDPCPRGSGRKYK